VKPIRFNTSERFPGFGLESIYEVPALPFMNVAIIVAAGKGTRMGRDKLWMEVHGVPIVGHTWRTFDRSEVIDQVVLVVREESQQAFRDLAEQIQVQKPFHFAPGGSERQDSVWNGLQCCPEDCDLVAIQDAARPCTHPSHIRACIEAGGKYGAVVAAQKVTDTLKRVGGGLTIQSTVDREGLWSVQTPQVFRVDVIRKAMQSVRDQGLIVTDDTAACESIGCSVKVVSGDHPNPKVTYPGDLPYISWLLANLDGGV
jgi:2-C-methyl-D-erythritol 4-phosphate cytidylyltransferase